MIQINYVHQVLFDTKKLQFYILDLFLNFLSKIITESRFTYASFFMRILLTHLGVICSSDLSSIQRTRLIISLGLRVGAYTFSSTTGISEWQYVVDECTNACKSTNNVISHRIKLINSSLIKYFKQFVGYCLLILQYQLR